jgi:hypothetical protein
MEFVRKGRRLVERENYRLEVPVEIATVRKSALPEAFVMRGATPMKLYGHDGGLWRQASGSSSEATSKGADLMVGATVAPALTPPRKNDKVGPLYAADERRIVSDEREARTEAARAAARNVMLVDGALWVKVREPQWLVRKGKGPDGGDVRLLADVDNHWREGFLGGGMRFRLDRLPQALAWARIARGSREASVVARGWDDVARDALAGPWGIEKVDFAFFCGDDVVDFARDHLRQTVKACAEVVEALPDRLRRRWEDLRAIQDNLSGPGARAAAEEGLALIAETLDMLTEVRDVAPQRRSQLMDEVTRLRLNDRRSRLEGVMPRAATEAVAEDDIAALAP